MNESHKTTQSDDGTQRAATILYRFDCPDSMELGEHYLGLVGEPRRSWIKDHIASCPLCLADLAGLKTFMTMSEAAERPAERPPAQPSILEKLQWLIADLVQPPQTGMAFALRGAEDRVRSYHAGNTDISLDVCADPAHPGRKQIVGLMLGAGSGQMNVGLAALGEMTPVSTAVLDDAGNFVLSDVALGVYDLLILPTDSSPGIRIPNLDIQV